MNRPKTSDCITMIELRTIERLCKFLTVAFETLYPEDFYIYDGDCEELGRICFNAGMEQFTFVPTHWCEEAEDPEECEQD